MTATLEKLTTSDDRRLFTGTIFTVLVSAEKTNNNIFIAEIESVPGSEPPRHFHTFEDEIFIIKEGTITFFPGDSIIQAGPGDTVLMPKNIPHHFVITSEKLKAILIATPGNIEYFFRKLSAPYSGNDIPAVQPPAEAAKDQIVSLMDSYGIYYV